MNYQNISNQELIKIVTSGCKFKYFSYDHKKAIKEYTETRNKLGITDNMLSCDNNDFLIKNPNCFEMPEEIKQKYKVEKIGKLREIHFNPSGDAWRFKIGAKYSKTFKVEDFGDNVFPILG